MAPRFDLVFQRAYSSFGEPGAFTATPGAAVAMRHAKEIGLVVGAIGDSYHRYIDNNLSQLGLHRDLDFALTSHEVGAPAGAAMFDAAAKRAAHASRLLSGDGSPIAPGEMLHVGASVTRDYLPARKRGMRALLLDLRGDARHAKLAGADVLRSLDELPSWLDAHDRERSCQVV